MNIYIKKKILFVTLLLFFIVGNSLYAETVNHIGISFSPRTGSFVQDSTFNVPILIDTHGISVNSIKIKINFDKNKLMIIQPLSGTSIIERWVESPRYDNLLGEANYYGEIPEGISTEGGLIGNIIFKALGSGIAVVSASSSSTILLNDGLNTNAIIDLGRAEYTILPKVGEGIKVFSETHPSEGEWFNNNNPVVSWENNRGENEFSFIMDGKPFTVPDNITDSRETSKSFEGLSDGLWYFHIKAARNGIWGATSHFLMKVDTVLPATFQPKASYLNDQVLISFFTGDNLSGIDHYEVGVVDKNLPASTSPAFVEATSPFQVPREDSNNLRVIVRAIDKAGNVNDASIDVGTPFTIGSFIRNNLISIIEIIAIILFIFFLTRYLFKRGIVRPLREPLSLNVLDNEFKDYIHQRKELNDRNTLELEQIQKLKKDIKDAEEVINEDSKDDTILP